MYNYLVFFYIYVIGRFMLGFLGFILLFRLLIFSRLISVFFIITFFFLAVFLSHIMRFFYDYFVMIKLSKPLFPPVLKYQ